jgi:hypothetical protein
MNYSGILQLLDNGFSAEDVLITLKNASPKIAKKIQKYIAGGLSVPEVLKGLIQDPSIRQVDLSKSRGSSPSEVQSLNLLQKYNSVPESRDKESLRYLQKFTRQAINIGSTAAGAYALSRAIPKAVQAIPEAMKQILLGQQPNPQEALGAAQGIGQQVSPSINNPLNPQQPPVSPTSIPQQGAPIQPEVKTIDVSGLLDKSGLKKHVDELAKSGRTSKEIAGLLYSKFPKDMKQFQAEAGKNMEDAIGDYLGQNLEESGNNLAKTEEIPLEQEKKSPKIEKSSKENLPTEEKQIDLTGMGKGMTDKLYQGLFDALQQGKDTFAGIKDPALAKAKPAYEAGLIKSPKDLQEFLNKPKIEKSSIVASPNGIGEVKAIKDKSALIDIDGKLTKVDVDDLENEPEDTIETVQQLLKIPEVDRSSIVSLFTYDPNDKEMYIQFHNGETYKYLDVDPEKVFKVANKMGIPITQGKNIFGAWSPEDKKSLGATLIKEIINDPKYKKTKHGEEPNPNYRQLETLYDYWEKLRKKSKRKRL